MGRKKQKVRWTSVDQEGFFTNESEVLEVRFKKCSNSFIELELENLQIQIVDRNLFSACFFALTALFICLKTLSCCLGHMKIFIGMCFLTILVFVKKQAFETQDFVRIPIGLSYMSFTFPSLLCSPLIIKLLPLLFIIRGNILKNVVPLHTLFIQSVTGLSR